MNELDKKLNVKEILHLKTKAHKLNPIIIIGSKGLTENVRLETDRALEVHELIKVRIHTADRKVCHTIATTLSTQCNASLVEIKGRSVVLYRKRIS